MRRLLFLPLEFERVRPHALGIPVPERFRSFRFHLRDPGTAVNDFIAWVEWTNAHSRSPSADETDHRLELIHALIRLAEQTDNVTIQNGIRNALRNVGVTPVSPLGETFDPDRHEADDATDAPDEAMAGTIAAVVAPGYLDGSRMIRPARVVIYREP